MTRRQFLHVLLLVSVGVLLGRAVAPAAPEAAGFAVGFERW
jgi:hypothetical protein